MRTPGARKPSSAYRADDGDGYSDEEEEQTFTMLGSVQDDEIIGDIIIGGLFRNAVVISDPKTIIDTGEGLRFTAAELP